MNSKSFAAIVALAVSAGLAGTGCMARSEDEATDGQDQVTAPQQAADVHSEKTGTASEKCGGFGGFGCGGSCGIPFWGGWGGCGIFGGPFWGSCACSVPFAYPLTLGACGGFGGCAGGLGGCW